VGASALKMSAIVRPSRHGFASALRFWVCIEVTDLNILQKSALPGVLVSGFGGFFPDDLSRQGCVVPSSNVRRREAGKGQNPEIPTGGRLMEGADWIPARIFAVPSKKGCSRRCELLISP
jgi:hypothetical protein